MSDINAQLNAAPIAVTVDHVSKTYPVPFLRLKKFFRRNFKPPVNAVRDVSLDIKDGEIFGLIGRNGAGKTTLTKIIATLIQPTSGAVSVKGHDTVTDDEAVRRTVGLAGAEERSFYWRLSAEQNLLFFARLYGLSSAAANLRIKELVSLLELEELTKRRFAELSTGNRQRLAVARAMLASPPVLLLDEPTRSLDPIAAGRMRATIKSLARDKSSNATIFLTSHNLSEVEELCDRVAIISKGQIRALDTPRNLRAYHTGKEDVTIIFAGLELVDAERALTEAIGNNSFVCARGAQTGENNLTFRQGPKDELLDRVLRILQESGGTVRSVEISRASLLDVMESYETESETAL